MILITAATGQNGGELVKRLLPKGVALRALVRNPDKAGELARAGVEIVVGDLSKPESFEAALDGVDKVFYLFANDPGMVELQKSFIEAAKRAGVQHFVKFSVLGVAENSSVTFLRWHWQMDEELKGAGLPYTILRPNAFYQNIIGSSAQTIKQQGAIYSPVKAEAGLSQVDIRDVAAVAAAVLTEEGHLGKVYEITGPTAISGSETATIMSNLLEKPVNYVEMTSESYRQSLLDYHLPEWFANDLVELDEQYSANLAAYTTNVVKEVAHKEPISFEQFAAEHINLFK